MAGVRKKPLSSGKYRGWYIDAIGETRDFTGTTSKAETLRVARKKEDEHREIRLGYRPAPHTADKHRSRPVAEIIQEYLDWGRAQGGRRNGPWGATHARMRESQILLWTNELGLTTLADLDGVLPRVEKVLRGKKRAGLTGKSLMKYAGTIRHFCNWCIERGYLKDDPPRGFKGFDTAPASKRRALTVDEVKKLLGAAPPRPWATCSIQTPNIPKTINPGT